MSVTFTFPALVKVVAQVTWGGQAPWFLMEGMSEFQGVYAWGLSGLHLEVGLFWGLG